MVSEKELENLIADQAAFGGWIDRIVTNLRSKDPDLGVLQKRQELLDSYWKQFLANHMKILHVKESADSEYVRKAYFDEIEAVWTDRAGSLASMIADKIESAAAAHPLGRLTPFPSVSGHSPSPRNFKLPELQLPKFSGDKTEWESFRDRYCAMFHNDPLLPSVQKFSYLKSCLKGDAANVIAGIPTTDAGYTSAWELPVARFGKLRVVSFLQMKALFEIPPAKKSSADELTRVLDALNKTIRIMRVLGKPVEHWDEVYVYLLTTRLDQYTRVL